YEAPGRTMGFEFFDTVDPEDVGRAAATRALTLLDSVPAPTGRIPVVLRRGAGGVLFHEACGHGLEADHIYKDASVFSGDMGQRVASPLVTLVDDGTYGREWGTLAIDDEGYPTQRNVLIEDGVLTEYMWDLLRARKEGHPSSGNRRVSDLLEIARRVAGAARPDEQVEAYVVRSRDTDVEVFGGEVESLTTAVVEGIGVRVVSDHCQGYAWAGSLDESVIADTLQD